MNEKRRLTRKIPAQPLELRNILQQESLGKLINLTVEGFLMISSKPIVIGSLYQLELSLEREIKGKTTVNIGVENVWSSDSEPVNSTYWSGFRIIDITDDDKLIIDEMIADWKDSID